MNINSSCYVDVFKRENSSIYEYHPPCPYKSLNVTLKSSKKPDSPTFIQTILSSIDNRQPCIIAEIFENNQSSYFIDGKKIFIKQSADLDYYNRKIFKNNWRQIKFYSFNFLGKYFEEMNDYLKIQAAFTLQNDIQIARIRLYTEQSIGNDKESDEKRIGALLETTKLLNNVGTLNQTLKGYTYLKIDNNYLHYLLPFIKPMGFIQPTDKIGAHISIISTNESEKKSAGWIVKEQLTFTIKDFKIISDVCRKGVKRMAVLTVESAEFGNVRKSVGIYDDDDKPRHYHITIGIEPEPALPKAIDPPIANP